MLLDTAYGDQDLAAFLEGAGVVAPERPARGLLDVRRSCIRALTASTPAMTALAVGLPGEEGQHADADASGYEEDLRGALRQERRLPVQGTAGPETSEFS
ncbi:hypothetical protein [Streptomyces coeruleorubidus]|uniref:hypothetical protein n=1 Tax=Streptomyces coeruleorubidus TaxID=116188 RepID=UPI0036C7E283